MKKTSISIPSRDEKFLPQTVDDTPIGLIYLITNKANGKQYIGQTTRTIEKRWAEHLYDAKRGIAYPICHAIRKYGADGFFVEEIAKAASLEQLNTLEPFYIECCNTLKPNGYNLASGGKNHLVHPDTRAKISSANKGNQYCKGRILSDETKAKISAANKGRSSHRKGIKLSDETKAKISASKKGQIPWSKGKPMSAETRSKLSAAKMGKKGTPHTDDFKKKLGERSIGNQYAKGRKQSSEEKARRSVIASKRWRGSDGRFLKHKNV